MTNNVQKVSLLANCFSRDKWFVLSAFQKAAYDRRVGNLTEHTLCLIQELPDSSFIYQSSFPTVTLEHDYNSSRIFFKLQAVIIRIYRIFWLSNKISLYKSLHFEYPTEFHSA